MEKIDSRTLPVDALNERRRRAVKMRLNGTSLKDAAAQCEMSRTTVIAAVNAYEAGGWKAVDVDRGGRPVGSGRTLSAEQEREVQRLIRERTPEQLKMVYALWTRQAVAELIRDRYGFSSRIPRPYACACGRDWRGCALMKQISLGLPLSQRRTRKRQFLDSMEQVVPWGDLVSLIEPYARESGRRG